MRSYRDPQERPWRVTRITGHVSQIQIVSRSGHIVLSLPDSREPGLSDKAQLIVDAVNLYDARFARVLMNTLDIAARIVDRRGAPADDLALLDDQIFLQNYRMISSKQTKLMVQRPPAQDALRMFDRYSGS